MNLYDVIKKPVITEKSMIALEAGKYTFEVDTLVSLQKLKKLSSLLQLILKQSSCLQLKLNNQRRN